MNRFATKPFAAGVALLLALQLQSASVCAADDDPFWGSDKALHFAVAGGIAGVGYGVTTAVTPDRWKALVVGGTLAIGAGALKEGLDATGLGDPSWKDFAWDVIGAACGLGVAWVIDFAAQGGHAPPLSAGSASLVPASPGASVVLRF